MKYLLIISTCILLLNGSDIERIDSIVGDIQKLRQAYAHSQQELQSCKVECKEKKDYYKKREKEFLNREEKYLKEIKILKNQINNLKNIEKSNNNKVEKIIETKVIRVKKSDNTFPKLLLKESSQTTKKVSKSEDEELVFTQPTTFRMKHNGVIYNRPNGEKVEQFEAKRSFTSNQRTNNWIKITGYFVNKKWKKATKELWVKVEDVSTK